MRASIEHVAHGFLFRRPNFSDFNSFGIRNSCLPFSCLICISEKGISVRVHYPWLIASLTKVRSCLMFLAIVLTALPFFFQVLFKITKECIGKILKSSPGGNHAGPPVSYAGYPWWTASCPNCQWLIWRKWKADIHGTFLFDGIFQQRECGRYSTLPIS